MKLSTQTAVAGAWSGKDARANTLTASPDRATVMKLSTQTAVAGAWPGNDARANTLIAPPDRATVMKLSTQTAVVTGAWSGKDARANTLIAPPDRATVMKLSAAQPEADAEEAIPQAHQNPSSQTMGYTPPTVHANNHHAHKAAVQNPTYYDTGAAPHQGTNDSGTDSMIEAAYESDASKEEESSRAPRRLLVVTITKGLTLRTYMDLPCCRSPHKPKSGYE
eukprot:gene29595-35727_t